MDDELIRLLKTNPEKGLEKLMNTYMGFVYTIVFNKLNSICSQEDIEECVSTVFYEAFQCRNNIDPAKGSIKSFLGVLAKRKAIDRFRQHIRHTNKDVPLDESFYASQSSGIDHETKAILT